MMNNQEVFNIVVQHLRKQNRKALNEDGDCVYRNDRGDKCAIGILIPDASYNKGMEGQPFTAFFPEVKSWECDINLLDELQCLHDDFRVNEWESQFEAIAEAYKLTMPV